MKMSKPSHCLKSGSSGTDVDELLYQLIISQLLHDSHILVAKTLMKEKTICSPVAESRDLRDFICTAFALKCDQGTQCDESCFNEVDKDSDNEKEDISVMMCSFEEIAGSPNDTIEIDLDFDSQTTPDNSAMTSLRNKEKDEKNKEIESTKRKRGRPRKYPLKTESPKTSFSKRKNKKSLPKDLKNIDSSHFIKLNNLKVAEKVKISHEENINPHTKYCYGCDRTFETAKECSTHILTGHFESDGNQKKCKICGKEMQTKSCRVHLLQHSDLTRFLCNICGDKFKLKCVYDYHMEKHAGNKIFCKMCDSGPFRMSKCLRRHIAMVHETSKPVKRWMCHICSKCFVDKYKLDNHNRSHTGERPFQCGSCSASFATVTHRRRHEQQHSGTKNFTCGLCNHSVFQRSNMRVHMRVHSTLSYSETRLLVCGLCRLCYHEPQALHNHTQEKHLNYDEELESLSNHIGLGRIKMIINPPNQRVTNFNSQGNGDHSLANSEAITEGKSSIFQNEQCINNTHVDNKLKMTLSPVCPTEDTNTPTNACAMSATLHSDIENSSNNDEIIEYKIVTTDMLQ